LSALALAILTALLLATLLAAGCAIILRITARCLLATAYTGALFNTLISFSVVCHISPPLFLRSLRIVRPSTSGDHLPTPNQPSCRKEISMKAQRDAAVIRLASIQTVQSA
jgi:hypothetical protein